MHGIVVVAVLHKSLELCPGVVVVVEAVMVEPELASLDLAVL
jgi:hypothetical protein